MLSNIERFGMNCCDLIYMYDIQIIDCVIVASLASGSDHL